MYRFTLKFFHNGCSNRLGCPTFGEILILLFSLSLKVSTGLGLLPRGLYIYTDRAQRTSQGSAVELRNPLPCDIWKLGQFN